MYRIKVPGDDGRLKEVNTPDGKQLFGSASSIGLEVRALDPSERTFWAIASTETPDREGDILLSKGWELANFAKNPIGLWCHDSWSPALFKVLEVKVKDKQLIFKPQFDDYEFAELVFRQYQRGFMNAFSVGFSFLDYDLIKEVDDEGFAHIVGRRSKKHELFEISAVAVGANPEALSLIEAKGMKDIDFKSGVSALDKGYAQILTEAMPAGVCDWCDGKDHLLIDLGGGVIREFCQHGNATVAYRFYDAQWNTSLIKTWIKYYPEIQGKDGPKLILPTEGGVKVLDKPKKIEAEDKGAIPYSVHGDAVKADEDVAWDGATARTHLSKWAGGPKTDDIDWGKYKKGFGWVDSESADTLGAYKLPHHDVVGSDFKVVWSGVKAAMAALLGARGGTAIPEGDRKGVYNHLAGHYAQFEKEVPEFKDYDIPELKELFVELKELTEGDFVEEKILDVFKTQDEPELEEEKADPKEEKAVPMTLEEGLRQIESLMKKYVEEVRAAYEQVLEKVAEEVAGLRKDIVTSKVKKVETDNPFDFDKEVKSNKEGEEELITTPEEIQLLVKDAIGDSARKELESLMKGLRGQLD